MSDWFLIPLSPFQLSLLFHYPWLFYMLYLLIPTSAIMRLSYHLLILQLLSCRDLFICVFSILNYELMLLGTISVAILWGLVLNYTPPGNTCGVLLVGTWIYLSCVGPHKRYEIAAPNSMNLGLCGILKEMVFLCLSIIQLSVKFKL